MIPDLSKAISDLFTLQGVDEERFAEGAWLTLLLFAASFPIISGFVMYIHFVVYDEPRTIAYLQPVICLLALIPAIPWLPLSVRHRISMLSVAFLFNAFAPVYFGNLTSGFAMFMIILATILTLYSWGAKIALTVGILASVLALLNDRSLFTFLVSMPFSFSAIVLTIAFTGLTLRREEDALAEARESTRALQSQNERQKRMFSIIAHELRTPAASIQMLINQHPELDRSGKQISAAAEHLLHVIDDLRQSVNPDLEIELNPEPYLLADLLEQVRTQSESILKIHQMSLDVVAPPRSDERYFIDAYRIRSILSNLVRNGFYHSQGSMVRVTLSIENVDNNTDRLVFLVEDDGKGFGSVDPESLFEPFRRGES